MKIFNMTKEDFAEVPFLNTLSYDDRIFNSLVIIPSDKLHDSGWRCMEFVAVDAKGNPMFKMSGYSDVLHIDGIGGYGNWYECGDTIPELVKPKGWSFDCLPCGYIRLMCNCNMKYGGGISDFQIYGVN
jgi:hypothetical protein